jgi:membrane protease YdiL (CAAX protease family)
MPRTSAETALFAVLACTAGLSEEFLYRGFAFAVFARMSAGSALVLEIAAFLASALFAIGHIYQGRRGLITTFVVGIIFSVVRIWSGSLVPLIVAHAGIDLVAGIYVSRFLPNG